MCKEFKNIVSFNKVSALKGSGVSELTDIIRQEMVKLQHIGTELPKVWIDIRKKLEGMDTPYIQFSDYIKLCKEFGLNEKKTDFLGDYYHDLGVFLHFKDSAILKEIVFLESEWATDAVYLLVESKEIQSNDGGFTYHDLKEKYWLGKYPVKLFPQLLELMKKFELCFKVDSESDSYVIPELLKSDKPQFNWSYKNNIRFVCQYKFMPAGILTRFIARNYQLIKDKIYWKQGVVLQSNDSSKTEALIVSERLHKNITIWIRGENKKEMLEYIRYDLLQIHETLNNPAYSELIPCVCAECQSSPEPYLWDLNVLQKAIKKDVKKMQCNSSFFEVPIKNIFNNLVTSENNVMRFMQDNSISVAAHVGAFTGGFWRIFNKYS